MAVSETSVHENEFTVTIGALVTSIINATWYTVSKIYEKVVNVSVPAITITDTEKEETMVLEGPFRGKTWLQRPMHRKQDKHLLVAPDILGSNPIQKGNSRFLKIPSEVLLEQAINRERYEEEGVCSSPGQEQELCEEHQRKREKTDITESSETSFTVVE